MLGPQPLDSPLLTFTRLQEGGACYLPFTQGEIEPRTDEMTCSKQVIIKGQSWDLD